MQTATHWFQLGGECRFLGRTTARNVSEIMPLLVPRQACNKGVRSLVWTVLGPTALLLGGWKIAFPSNWLFWGSLLVTGMEILDFFLPYNIYNHI